MESDGREDLVVVIAGLLGVLVGHALRHRRGRSTDSPFTTVGTSTLVATPALARVAGEVLRVDRANTRALSVLSLAVGAVLTYFADDIARHLPGVASVGGAGQG